MSSSPFMVYIFLPISDLCNKKTPNPLLFSEKLQAFISLLQTFYTHQLMWDDCQQLLATLFMGEDRIQLELWKLALSRAAGYCLMQRPRQSRPSHPLDPLVILIPMKIKRLLDTSCQTLLRGFKVAGRKPTNWSKVSQVIHRPDKSPTRILEMFCESYQIFTAVDSDALDNQRFTNMTFVIQSAPDMRKLQILEEF